MALSLLLATVRIAPAMLGAPSVAHTDSIEGRFVRHIEIDPRTIFDPLPAGGFRGFYAVANHLHVRTRMATVRAHLVFRAGERWSEARRAETARQLRALDFVVPDSITTTPIGTDSLDVRIVTHDNWTTSPEFNLEGGGGQRYGSVSFNERNLLGLGTSLSLVYRHDPAGDSRFVALEDGAILGSHWRSRFVASSGAAGGANAFSIGLPFWADAAPVSAGLAWQRSNSEAQLFSRGVLVARTPRRQEITELTWGIGRQASDGMIQRFIGSFFALDNRLGETRLEPGAPPEFGGGFEEVRVRRLAGEAFLWRPRFLVRRGIEQVDREEDIDVGRSLSLKTGFSPQAFGGSDDEAFARVKLALGADAGARGFGVVRATVQTRVRSGLRESLVEMNTRWVRQPLPNLTALLAVLATAGYRQPRDFQLTLGGLSGLRAYPVRELSGTQVWRCNGELRWVAKRDIARLVSLGGAAFWDSGRTWGPGSGGERWLQDIGLGLRLSLPHSALNSVARFDVAWPVRPALDGSRRPVFSFGSGQAF